MIEYFEKIDQTIVLTINSWNTPFLDEVMWIVSGKLTWSPLYLVLIYLSFKKLGTKNTLIFISLAITVVALSDLSCTYLFKKVFLRYRPSHNLLLENKLHLYRESNGSLHRGGKYGFISSHAANFFGIAVFAGLVLKTYFKKLIYILLSIGCIVAFSRLYLGVHYLSDILVGAIVGSLYATIVYQFIYKNHKK